MKNIILWALTLNFSCIHVFSLRRISPEKQVATGDHRSNYTAYSFQKGLQGSDDLLFVTPVGSFERTIAATKRNVQHLRATYPGRVDVVLFHYDQQQAEWMADSSSGDWYKENVQGFMEEKGGKFQLLQKYFKDVEPMKKYSWIWAADEDFDITGIDIPGMMQTAEDSGSKIVAPAVRFPAKASKASKASMQPFGSYEAADFETSFCGEGDRKCKFQFGNPACKYSYANYLELMLPMFRPEALRKLLTECEHCIHDHSMWGLDHVWCKFVADKLNMTNHDHGCAILDQSHALKLVFHTLPQDYHSHEALNDTRAHNPNYYVTHMKHQCVKH
jgi:hypothetical protein